MKHGLKNSRFDFSDDAGTEIAFVVRSDFQECEFVPLITLGVNRAKHGDTVLVSTDGKSRKKWTVINIKPDGTMKLRRKIK